MSDAFELDEPREARAFLQSFAVGNKRLGEALFRRAQVLNLVPVKPGAEFVAQVDGELVHNVQLRYDRSQGWRAQCSCKEAVGCQHIYAAMSALLAEHSTAAVRKLSASLPTPTETISSSPSRKETPASHDLAQRLLASTGAPLNREQTNFLRKVRETYARSAQTRQITSWDFQQMGFPIFGYGWNALNIWPAFPDNEYEFWLYVAHEVIRQGHNVPEFMMPITDLTLIDEKLLHWEREQEVERWKNMLRNFEHVSASAHVAATETDLRLAIGQTEARLQWKRPGQADFEPLKQNQMRKLSEDYNQGTACFSPAAELLWQVFTNRQFYYQSAKLDLEDEGAVQLLGPLLRSQVLDGRIVDLDGRPLRRVAEPLRWQMKPAEDQAGDYVFRLVQADDAPAPCILSVLPGSPTLYLTENAIFTGPAAQNHLLDPSEENRIPAAALERASGVKFLRALGIELPQRLRERVRTVSYEITVSCELQPTFPGSTTEDCVMRISAVTPDGRLQLWDGYSWKEKAPTAGRKAPPNDELVIYDTSLLHWIIDSLHVFNPKPDSRGPSISARVTRKFPEAFSAWFKSLPPAIHVVLEGELASLANADVAGSVKLDVAEAEIDWFDLRVVLHVEDTALTPAEIKLLLNAKGRYVRLPGKGWRRLQYALTSEEDERLARLGLSPHELSAEPQRLHALQLADEAASKLLPEQQVAQIQRRVSELKTRVTPDLPAGVTAQLRPYQLEGFHFLAYLSTNRFGGILADDMGLGKTLQTLAWLLWLRSQHDSQAPVPPSLVVCPKSVMDNWHAEAARFTPQLRVRCWAASELEAFFDGLAGADLHVLNYSQLRLLGERLTSIQWLAVILDEGQYIKNPSSQTAQVARSLRSERRLVLSGTPIENRLLDLWSLMAFAMPGVLSSRANFARIYDAKGDPFARRRLSARVRPFLLRRTKAQVAKDLPDRIEEDLFCEIEGEQKALYRAELKRAQQLLLRVKTQQELAQQQFHFLTSLLRLRQICCHPRLLQPDSKEIGAKAEALLEQLEPLMEEGQKVLVFSQFVELLNLLRPMISERNWPMFYLTGETENRGQLVKDFQSQKGPAVFLISLKAGGFGLNLTAASYVVLFDPWWNPAVENQAIDRTHRIGQTNKVIAYRLLIKDSIEEKIRSLQKQKKTLAEDVLGEEKFAQNLTLQDFQFLFAD